MTYTTNLAQNPGMQLGLTGYAAINNATITLSTLGAKSTGALFGNAGLLVTTPGAVAEEGIITPASSAPTTGTYSASVYIQGTSTPGDLIVSVISNPGGIVVGSAQVSLTDVYQRVVINSLAVTGGNTLSLIISTSGTEAVQFWIANIQIEPESPAHPYCDGSLPGCTWQTTVGGVSLQQFQNILSAVSNIYDGSAIVNILIKGEVFNLAFNPAIDTDASALVTNTTAPGPVGALTDFAIFASTDLDPAQTYVSWNNAGITVPTSGYARSFGSFFPSQDYVASNNQQLFTRAAYMAVGWQFSNVPNNAKVVITDVQAEINPFTTGFAAVIPSSYGLPRSIDTTIKPDRLNYCTNPSFEVSTANWNPVGSGVLTQDGTTAVGPVTSIDDSPQDTGTAALNVATTNPSGDGASITLTNLIAGDTYIVSAYVQADTGVTDILMSCSNGATSIAHGNSGTGYDVGGYGTGYYGGNPPPTSAPDLYGTLIYGTGLFGVTSSLNVIPTGQWFRIYTTFQPTDSVAILQFTCTAPAPTDFWIDAVLVEPGEVLNFYFDGNFGQNYFWEQGGTPGLCRSYFYDEYFTKAQAVTNVLSHHTPYGISYVPPVFFQPPTQ